MRKVIVFFAIVGLFCQSCSIHHVMRGPPPFDLNQVKVGTPRSTIMSVFGSPKMTEKQNDIRIDMHEFIDGHSAGSKSRVILYIVGDIFTLGLAELIFWPIELGVGQGIEGRAVITYGPDDISKSISIRRRDGSPWPIREEPAKSSEQKTVTINPDIKTGESHQPSIEPRSPVPQPVLQPSQPGTSPEPISRPPIP